MLTKLMCTVVSNCVLLDDIVVCFVCVEDDWRYSQTNDVRSQLKFLEQLERLEKQRREEEEREALLRIARVTSKLNKSGKPTVICLLLKYTFCLCVCVCVCV